MKRTITQYLFFGMILCLPVAALPQHTIPRSVIAGGGTNASGVTGSITGTVGQIAGTMSDSSFSLQGGFWYGIYGADAVTASDILPPDAVRAIDLPDDDGGYVLVSFIPSPNHEGYTELAGYCGDTAPIDYYLISRGTDSDYANATSWAMLAADTKGPGDPDTIRVAISTRSDMSTYAYYWVCGVRGPALTLDGNADETPVGGYPQAPLVQQVTALGKTSEPMSDGTHLVSAVCGPNRSLASDNTELTADFNSDGVVDGLDFGMFSDMFLLTKSAAEFDPLFDLDDDGTVIDGLDFGIFSSLFLKTLPGFKITGIEEVLRLEHIREDIKK